MNRIADSAVPGAEKTALIEDAAPTDAAAMDKFGVALRQAGYDPVSFEARDLRWVQGSTDRVSALVTLKTENPRPATSRIRWSSPWPTAPGSWRVALPTSCWVRTPLRRAAVRLRLHRPHPRNPALTAIPRMWIGWLEFDLLLGDVRSLKQKRSIVRP